MYLPLLLRQWFGNASIAKSDGCKSVRRLVAAQSSGYGPARFEQLDRTFLGRSEAYNERPYT